MTIEVWLCQPVTNALVGPTRTAGESSARPKLEPITVIREPPAGGELDPPKIEVSLGGMYEKAVFKIPGVPATSISILKPWPVPELRMHLKMVFEFANVTEPQAVLPTFAVTPAKESPILEPDIDMVVDPAWKDEAKFGFTEISSGAEYENAAALERI